MRDMIDKMNNGGKMALLGIAPTGFAVDWNKIIFKMLSVKGIYGREMFETWYKMTALVQSGLDLTELITHRIPIDDFQDGFAAMISGEAGKVVMDWGVASSQNTQGVKVVAVSAERPKVPTMGKTTDGRFVGENTGASLYRPYKNRHPKG